VSRIQFALSILLGSVALAACTNGLHAEPLGNCTYHGAGAVELSDDDVIGFSAIDVVEAISVSTSGVSSSGRPGMSPTGTALVGWPVEQTFKFEAMEAELVEYAGAEGSGCPSGAALLVKAAFSMSGSVGDWSVSWSTDSVLMAASSATRSTTWSVPQSENIDVYSAVIDEGLAAIVRAALPSTVDPNCDLDYSVSPHPFVLYPDNWETNLATGGLAVRCETTYWAKYLVFESSVVESSETKDGARSE
jgi:hypothetical protein